MNDLKQKCLALGEALYAVLSEVANLQAANLCDNMVEIAKTEEQPKKRGPKPKDQEKAAEVKAPEPEVKVPEPVKAPEPVKEESIDDLFAEEAPVQSPKTIDDVKNFLMNWAKQDLDNRKPKAIGIFTQATGLESFKLLTEANATEMFYKLEKHLKNYK